MKVDNLIDDIFCKFFYFDQKIIVVQPTEF